MGHHSDALASLVARGLISADEYAAGMALIGLYADRRCWDPCDPFRQLFEGCGGARSPMAECLVALLCLGWTIDEFARSGWDGRRMARSTPVLLLRAGLATLAAQLRAADPDYEPDCDDETEDG